MSDGAAVEVNHYRSFFVTGPNMKDEARHYTRLTLPSHRKESGVPQRLKWTIFEELILLPIQDLVSLVQLQPTPAIYVIYYVIL